MLSPLPVRTSCSDFFYSLDLRLGSGSHIKVKLEDRREFNVGREKNYMLIRLGCNYIAL